MTKETPSRKYLQGDVFLITIDGSTPTPAHATFFDTLKTDCDTIQVQHPVFFTTVLKARMYRPATQQLSPVESVMVVVRDVPLPVQLVSFSARFILHTVNVEWSTLSEKNCYGFHVLRDHSFLGFIPGHGTTIEPHQYRYIDASPKSRASYRLKMVDLDGTVSFSDSVLVVGEVPGDK